MKPRKHETMKPSILLLLTTIFFSSCFLTKPAVKKEDQEKKEDKEIVVIDSVKDDDKKDDVKNDLKLLDEYHISVLLPFNLDTVDLFSIDPDEDDFPRTTQTSVQFYEGMMMALDQLKNQGLKAVVHVYDTESNEYEINSIIKDADFIKSNLIIGPVAGKQVQTVADFAKLNQIPMISPITSANNISGNAFFVSMNPTAKIHAQAIMDYAYSKFTDSNIMMISEKTESAEELADYIRSYSARFSHDTINTFYTGVYVDQKKAEEQLKVTLPNVIIIPSFDEAFVTSVTRTLSQLADDYQITVFGMPNWIDFESTRLDYYQLLNLHITDAFFLSRVEMIEHPIFSDYSLTYQAEPGEYVYRGYEIMYYFGKLIATKGLSMMDYLNDEEIKKSCSSPFDMQLVNHGKTDMIDYYENHHVEILRLMDFELVKAE